MPSSALAFWWMNELCAAAFAPVPVLSVSWMTRYLISRFCPGRARAALGKKVGHHRNILNVGQTGVGLRLAEHDLLCQHARRKRHDHQSDRQHQADPKSLAFLFACHDSPCLFRITSSCFFHCTTFYAIFQNKDCKLSMYKGNIIQSGLWRYQCIKFARKSRLSNYMMLPGKFWHNICRIRNKILHLYPCSGIIKVTRRGEAFQQNFFDRPVSARKRC